MIGLKDLDDEPDDAARREKLAALLPFGAGELAKEIFVDPSKGIVVEAVGNLGDFLQ